MPKYEVRAAIRLCVCGIDCLCICGRAALLDQAGEQQRVGEPGIVPFLLCEQAGLLRPVPGMVTRRPAALQGQAEFADCTTLHDAVSCSFSSHVWYADRANAVS